MSGWTNERVAALKALWGKGLSASQIATALGDTTRNAVIGKIHRLGLASRAVPSRPIPTKKRTACAPKAVAQVSKPAPKVFAQNLPLSELLPAPRRQCGWIEGDPRTSDAQRCANPVAPNSRKSFCEHHLKEALTPDSYLDRTKRQEKAKASTCARASAQP